MTTELRTPTLEALLAEAARLLLEADLSVLRRYVADGAPLESYGEYQYLHESQERLSRLAAAWLARPDALPRPTPLPLTCPETGVADWGNTVAPSADLAALLDAFDGFCARARARLVQGRAVYGDAWRNRDNMAALREEAEDAYVYGFFDWLRAQTGSVGGPLAASEIGKKEHTP